MAPGWYSGYWRWRERRRDRVSFANMRKIRGGEHAFRVIAAYEKWFTESGEAGARQLAVLRLMGLFDRQADATHLAVLRTAPAIEGLTEPLVDMEAEDWTLLIAEVVDIALITQKDGDLDAHPLIREYFGRQLREKNPEAWQSAHGRLFDHLKDSTDHHPEGLTALQPLYQAVHHGCQAGWHQKALNDVYRDRILRGIGDDDFYSSKKLGAFGADLGAIAGFFETPWSRVSPSLSAADQAWVLNSAAFSLRALGRLREAGEPMRAGLAMRIAQEAWKNAAGVASNLSRLELALGEVTAAVDGAELSVVFADRSGDAFERISRRTALADVRHQSGAEATALLHFREAERLQVERQPSCPLLYSLWGFRYCELLLAPADLAAGSSKGDRAAGKEACAEVERRATQTILIAERNNWLLDVALDHLNLGRVRLYRAILDDRASQAAKDVQAEIENAVAGLRAAGHLAFIPFGLLTRAWLRFVTGDENGARADLEEAQEIAERGSMRLHLADVALYRARFFGDRDALVTARRLVDECGYGRRRAELAILEERLLGSLPRG